MRVWRIEHEKTRQGPYTKWSGVDAYAAPHRPCPYNDTFKCSFYDETDRFGFESISKLRAWFDNKDLRTMKKHGFVCRIYDVPRRRVRKAKTQVIFKVKSAKLVRKSKVIK